MKQETRQWVTAVTMYLAWSAAVALSFLRATDQVEQQFGSMVFLFIGVALAAGVKLSRMRLTRTMIAVFNAGVTAAEQREIERREREQREESNG